MSWSREAGSLCKDLTSCLVGLGGSRVSKLASLLLFRAFKNPKKSPHGAAHFTALVTSCAACARSCRDSCLISGFRIKPASHQKCHLAVHLDELAHPVIEDEDNGRTRAAEDVGKGPVEEACDGRGGRGMMPK